MIYDPTLDNTLSVQPTLADNTRKLLDEDPFLFLNSDLDSLLPTNWPASQPISPKRTDVYNKNAFDNSDQIASAIDIEQHKSLGRRSTPPRSPRTRAQRDLPNLYDALQKLTPPSSMMTTTSPMMMPSPFGWNMSPPMPMIMASPVLMANQADDIVQQPSQGIMWSDRRGNGTINTSLMDGVINTCPDDTIMMDESLPPSSYAWMQANRGKRRKASVFSQPSPLLTSTTMNNLGGAPNISSPAVMMMPNGTHQASSNAMYNMMAMSYYHQRPPKLAMPPIKKSPNSQSIPSNASPHQQERMVLPFHLNRQNNIVGLFDTDDSNNNSNSEHSPTASSASTPDSHIMHDMERSCRYFISKASKIDYDNVTVIELKGLLKECNQPATGKKAELVDRVQRFHKTCEEFLKSFEKAV